MNKPKNTRTLQEAKKQIAQKSKEFESRLMKARNAFEQIGVLNDMTELIEAEVFQWTSQIATDKEDDETQQEELINEAAKHISELSDFLSKLNDERKRLLPDALKVQQAMINSHQLKSPIIKPE